MLLGVPACSLVPTGNGIPAAPPASSQPSAAPAAAVLDPGLSRQSEPSPQDAPTLPPGKPEKLGNGPLIGEVRQDAGGAADTRDVFNTRLQTDIDLSCQDYCHYYSPGNLAFVALGIGLAAPLANTPADLSVRKWYRTKVRGETTDEIADVFNYAGQLWVVLPIVLEWNALKGKADEDYAFDGGLYEWSNRSLRAMAVGFPPVLLMYAGLGSSRPDRENSHWHPFQDVHGVSGHTFVGAVPFLTAAAMTDDPLYKYPLVMGSFLTGWARLNNDKHFFSQIALGWWMAYAAVHSVNLTQDERRSLSIAPTMLDDGPGLALQLHF